LSHGQSEIDNQQMHLELQKHEKQTSNLQTELNLCEAQLQELRDRKFKIENEQLPDLNSKKATAVLNRKFKDAAQFQSSIKTMEEQLAKIDPESADLEKKMSLLDVSLRKNITLLDSLREKYTNMQHDRAQEYLSHVLVPEWLELSKVISELSQDVMSSSDAIVRDAVDILTSAAQVCEAEIQESRDILQWDDDQYEDLINSTKVRLGFTDKVLASEDNSDGEEETEEQVAEEELSQEETDTQLREDDNEDDHEEYQQYMSVPQKVEEEEEEPQEQQETNEEDPVITKMNLIQLQEELSVQISKLEAALEEALENADYDQCDILDTQSQTLKKELLEVQIKLQSLIDVQLEEREESSPTEQEGEQYYSSIPNNSEELTKEPAEEQENNGNEEETQHSGAVLENEPSSFSFIQNESEVDEAESQEESHENVQQSEEDEHSEPEEASSFSFIKNDDNNEGEEENTLTEEVQDNNEPDESSSFDFMKKSSESEEVEETEEEPESAFSFIGNQSEE